MRGFWTKTIDDSRATVSEGTFDDTGVEDEWADFIIIAQVCIARCESKDKRNERSSLSRTGIPLGSRPMKSLHRVFADLEQGRVSRAYMEH
jgi:hypothetical protein